MGGPAKQKRTAAERIKGGKLKTKEFPACMDPDLVDEHDDLLRQRAAAKAGAKESLAAGDVTELDGQIADVLERIADETVVLVLQARPRPKFKALKDKHPARRDDDGNPAVEHAGDWRLGVNMDTFFDPLIRSMIISPELDDETLTMLLDERLSDGQWDALTTVAWNLNQDQVNVPFSPAASPRTRRSSPR